MQFLDALEIVFKGGEVSIILLKDGGSFCKKLNHDCLIRNGLNNIDPMFIFSDEWEEVLLEPQDCLFCESPTRPSARDRGHVWIECVYCNYSSRAYEDVKEAIKQHNRLRLED